MPLEGTKVVAMFKQFPWLPVVTTLSGFLLEPSVTSSLDEVKINEI